MKIESNFTPITPFLYITAVDRLCHWKELCAHRISCIINLGEELPELVCLKSSGIECLKYPIVDVPKFPAYRYFDLVADRIARNVAANRRTLLYCQRGRSRSLAFALAYLIKHHHLPLSMAFRLVQQKRPSALPNIGFWHQLKHFECSQRKD